MGTKTGIALGIVETVAGCLGYASSMKNLPTARTERRTMYAYLRIVAAIFRRR